MRGAGRPLFTVTLVLAVAVHASAQENVTPRTAQSTTDGRQAKSASPTPGGLRSRRRTDDDHPARRRERFMSMQVIDEDQYTHGVIYQPGSHTLSRDNIGTRYVLVALRILVDPANPQDVAQVHALQDAITVSQAGPGRFELQEAAKALTQYARRLNGLSAKKIASLHQRFLSASSMKRRRSRAT